MSSYIGKVQIGSDRAALVGSTLYGVCNSDANVVAKTVLPKDLRDVTEDATDTKFINNNFDTPLQGVTIHVKFINGNTATSGLTLQVGSVITAYNIVGNCTCSAGTVISFTFDENQHWIVNDNTITEYEFMTAYNATTNKVATAADLTALNIQAAAHAGVISSDLGNHTTSSDLPTAQAVAQYVQAQTGGLGGLTGAMHFRGIVTDVTVTITDGSTTNPNISGYTFNGNSDNAGDVILQNGKEFVWTGTAWELLGDEGSYALKSSTATIVSISSTGFVPNTLPTLSVTATTASFVSVTAGSTASLSTTSHIIPVVTQAGRATTASVTAGILNITLGQDTTLSPTAATIKGVDTFTTNIPTSVSTTAITIGSASGWSAGSQATLGTTSTIVVIPNSTT